MKFTSLWWVCAAVIDKALTPVGSRHVVDNMPMLATVDYVVNRPLA
jgi:hypothetical protein